MGERSRDAPLIALWIVVGIALVAVLALVVTPIVAHVAWDVFVHFWNVV